MGSFCQAWINGDLTKATENIPVGLVGMVGSSALSNDMTC